MNYKYDEEFCKAFGVRVRQIRLAKGYSMRGFAFEIEMEYSQLSKIERGVTNPTISTVKAIAEGLQVSTKDLFDFEEIKKRNRK